jgi:hypothetical protein
MDEIVIFRAVPEKVDSGDSHCSANMIQAPCWEEASMDGKAVSGRIAENCG